jgi:hypothetical protein
MAFTMIGPEKRLAFASMIVLGVQLTADEAGSTRERIPQRDASVQGAHVPAGSNLLVARLHSRISADVLVGLSVDARSAHATTARLAAPIKFAFATVSVTTEPRDADRRRSRSEP